MGLFKLSFKKTGKGILWLKDKSLFLVISYLGNSDLTSTFISGTKNKQTKNINLYVQIANAKTKVS